MTVLARVPIAGDPAPEGEVLAQVRAWRRGRADRTLLEALGDAYVAIATAVVLGSMVLSALAGSPGLLQPCASDACTAARGLTAPLAWAVGASASLAAAHLFGPVLLSAAEGFWLLATPLRRGRLVRGRVAAAVGVALVLGAVWPVPVLLVAGLPGGHVAAWAGASSLTCGALVAWAALEQSRTRTRPLALARGVAGAAAVLLAIVLVAVAAGRLAPPAELTASVPLGVASVAGLGLVGAVLALARRLDDFPRGGLTSGGALVAGLQGAFLGLDLGLAGDILADRAARERGHVVVRPGRGRGWRALVHRDALRLVRTPRRLVAVVGAAAVPYAAFALGLGPAAGAAAALALMGTMIPVLGSLRVLSRTRGLARSLPLSPAVQRAATLAVPAAVALAWVAASAPAWTGVAGGAAAAAPDALLSALGCGLAGLVGAARWQTAPPADFTGPMVSTEMGAVPPNLVLGLARGADLALRTVAPLRHGLPPATSVVVGAVVLGLLVRGRPNPAP